MKSPRSFGQGTDSLYAALADKRRRYTLHYLKQRGEPVTVRELSEQVAAWENDKDIAEISSKERKRVYVALYQSHLDTLDKEGLVNYSEADGTVELTPHFAGTDIYLEVVPEGSIHWGTYYLGLVAANAILLTLVYFETYPFTFLPLAAWMVLMLASFFISAVVQHVSGRQMKFGDDGPPPDVEARTP